MISLCLVIIFDIILLINRIEICVWKFFLLSGAKRGQFQRCLFDIHFVIQSHFQKILFCEHICIKYWILALHINKTYKLKEFVVK